MACESDFASLDSDVINPDNAVNFLTDVQEYPMVTYTKNTGPVQTNGLSSYLLGYYNDPVYGSGTANFVSQVGPASYGPTFGDNVVLDSVVLTIPYFSTTTDTDEEGFPIYDLDSVIGDSPIRLSVYKSNYFLRNFDPGSEFNETQKYFSNGSLSEAEKIDPVDDLEGIQLYQDDSFVPSSDIIVLTEINEESGESVESVRLVPGIRVLLDNPNDTFWQDLIFNKEGEPELSNQNNFLDYFRGIYIKSEMLSMDGSMILLNIGAPESNITIYYTSDDEADPDSGEEAGQSQNTFVLNFIGNQVAIYDNNIITIPDGDQDNGDERLYLKGGGEGILETAGGGSMAIVDLFSGQVENDEGVMEDSFENFLKTYRKMDEDGEFIIKGGDYQADRLINEAYLEFFVDQNVGLGQEPERVYLYDLDNEVPLIDYLLDQSVTATTSKIVFSEPLKRVNDEVDGDGIRYKIRITEHLNNLVSSDSTNVKLGLVVTYSINEVNNFNLQDEDEISSSIPTGAILYPLGTVLHGNNSSNPDKKARLKIFYTEPDN